ncbi:MAG: phenylalanine--tRNA ligase subunit beta [Clostridiales bacterium]|nr:phenylalanine--tRNA ligase subunit beta [Clostridiales bacterium]
MLVPIKWLKEYVDINVSTKTLADAMTMTGTNVESIAELAKDIEKVVVGKILSIDPHPNADKLVVCKVDIGEEVLQIVTGAPNVKEGQLVPVATHGALLPGGIKIKKGKLRGEISQGMLCSADELKLAELGEIDDGVDGILVLDEEYPLGMDIKEALELGDEVIEFEVTSNRPDCLSMEGIAREAAVALKTSYSLPEIKLSEKIGDRQEQARVVVEDPQLCPRYCARVVKNVKIGPSPRWMRRRLAAAGVRPINNIVDITNYVMLELGQPMHAFDLDKIKDSTIVIRKAKEGEKLVTLDKQERILTEDMLVIADTEKAIGLAGVMGGYNTEVTSDTQNVILESANFDKASIRLTSKTLGLRSEASIRFEKSLDIVNAERAIDRAAQLIEELGAGEVVEGKIDVCNASLDPRVLEIEWKRINALLGIDLDVDEICQILNSLSFKTEAKNDLLVVEVPSFRQDIEGVADLTEEVARIYGYNKIPMTLMEGSRAQGTRTREQKLLDTAKRALTAMGLFEAVTYSFVSPKVYGKIGFKPEEYPEVVTIANPLGEDQSIMRTTLIPSILEVLARNRSRSIEECRIFEIGNIFIPRSVPVKELPIERLTLTIGQYGDNIDFYTIKGQVEGLLDIFGILEDVEFAPYPHPSLHPGRTAIVKVGDQELGVLGEVHPKVCDNYNLKTKVYLAELNFELMVKLAKTEKQYISLPKYPAITRDLAIVVSKSVLASSIERLIRKTGGALLESVELFDIYEGSQIPEGHRSLAYSLSYRSADRTLKDDDVNPIHNKIVNALVDSFDAQLRE